MSASIKRSRFSLLVAIGLGCAVLFVGLVAYSMFDMHVKTVRHMQATSAFLNTNPSDEELLARLGKPRLIYSNWSDVPTKFQRGLTRDGSTNAVFYLYTHEGMLYWYCIVAIDPISHTVRQGVATNY